MQRWPAQFLPRVARRVTGPRAHFLHRTLLGLIALLATGFSLAAEPPTLRVLLVGNSYTFRNDLPEMLSAMSGGRIEAEERAVGGSTLRRHAAEADLREALASGRFDVVVLQEQSLRPLKDREAMAEGVRLLAESARAGGTRVLLMSTWPRRHRPQDLAGISEAYRAVAAEVDAAVAPVGEAWRRAREGAPEIELYDPDGSHPTPAGSYLAACVLLESILGDDAVVHPIPNPALTEAAIETLRGVAGLSGVKELPARSSGPR